MKRIGLIAALLAVLTVPAAAMSKTTAQALGQAITNAGYEAVMTPVDGGAWTVRGIAPDLSVPIATANTLAVNQGVVGFTPVIEYGPMTLAKMQAVVQAVTDAGYQARATPVSAGVWKVQARGEIPTADAAALATAQAVAGFISIVEYR